MKSPMRIALTLFVFLLADGLVAVDTARAQGVATSAPSGPEVPITTSSEKARELYKQARDLVESFREHEAVPLLKEAIAQDPSFALAHLLLGKATRHLSGSRQNLDRALELLEGISEGERLTILIEEAMANGERAKALELLQKLAQAYPNDKRILVDLGTRYVATRRYEEALKYLGKAMEIDPEYPEVYNVLGYGYNAMERYGEAEKAFKKYVELRPEEPNAHHSYAEFLRQQNRFDESIASLEKTLELEPHFYRAYMDMGSILVWQNKHEDARALYQKLYENAPDASTQLDAYISTAVSYVDEGRMDEALQEMDKAYADAEKEGNNFGMSVNRTIYGRILFHAGRLDESLHSFRRFVAITELAPELPQRMKDAAWRDLIYFSGRIALAKGDLPAAKAKSQEYRQLVEAAGERRGIRLAHELAGQIALAEQDYDLAVTELQQSDLLNAGNYLKMGQAYLGKKDPEAAREMIGKAAHFNRVNSFMFAFVRREAIELLEEMN